MNRTFFVTILLAVIGGLLIPVLQHLPSKQSPLTAEQELTLKNNILQKDLALTETLNKHQYKSELKNVAVDGEIAGNWSQHLSNATQKMQDIRFIQWKAQDPSVSSVKINKLSESQLQSLKTYIQAAEQATSRQQSYESKRIELDETHTYFVIGEPTSNGALIAVFQPDHLSNLVAEQRKDLRIVPFPSDKRVKLQSVDADSMRDVEVDHPEDNEGTSHYFEQEVVAKFKKDLSSSDIKKICQKITCADYKKLDTISTYIFSSAEYNTKEMISYFKKNWDPVYVEPHYMYIKNDEALDIDEIYIPNDELFKDYQWNLPEIETLQGWNITKGDENIIVAVVDTGIDLDHPDLHDKIVQGYNAINSDNEPHDDVGHGSHVAGIIAANVDNQQGVAGMSWYNKIMPIKVLDESGAGSAYHVAQGIIWATDHGASVINLSLGNYVDSQFLHDAVRYAYDRGVVLIAASGNDNTSKPGYPAAYPEVFAVAATDYKNERAIFSNYGDYIDVAAPGEHIASTYMNGQYAALSGTSMATPHVSALAAMIRSIRPSLSNIEVMNIMRTSVLDLGEAGKDIYYGYGLIDVKKALESAFYNQQSQLPPHLLEDCVN